MCSFRGALGDLGLYNTKMLVLATTATREPSAMPFVVVFFVPHSAAAWLKENENDLYVRFMTSPESSS